MIVIETVQIRWNWISSYFFSGCKLETSTKTNSRKRNGQKCQRHNIRSVDAKNWGRRKSWGGRNKKRKGEVEERGKIPKRESRPLPCSKVAVHLLLPHCQVRHFIPRDTLANGFCREAITMTASPDVHILQVARSKQTSAHRTRAQLPSLWTTDQFCSTWTWKQADHVTYLFFAFGYSAHSTVLLKWRWLWLDPSQKSAENKSSKEKQ